jgi:UDP-N-acetylglucosamine 2-epimerase (non-hydrolysing)
MMAFGTRPEAIKMSPLYHALKADRDRFKVTLCVTGQHRQMLDQTLAGFEISADYDLDIMQTGQDLSDITSRVLLGMREVVGMARPDILLVHGDTTTCMAASLAAFYAGIQVGHVEAGLRTYDLAAPFPEEMNRQITGRIAHWHFAPTQNSKQNLQSEGVCSDNIFVTGNTVIDALQWTLARIDADNMRQMDLEISLSALLPFNYISDRFVLVTGHRRENFGFGFAQICKALRKLALTKTGARKSGRPIQCTSACAIGLSAFCLFAKALLFGFDR